MKRWTKKLLWRLGYDLQSIRSSGRDVALALSLIRDCEASVIIDVGANKGQYAEELLNLERRVRIVSFEPTSAAHAVLSRRAAAYSNWLAAERMAIGDTNGTIDINVSANSVSSSVLDMLDTHSMAAPESSYVDVETTPLSRLDEVLPRYVSDRDRLYLKMDTQGYEGKVLLGASGMVDQIFGVQIELSFVPLYRGQMMAFELIDFLERLGFSLYGFSNGFRDRKSGRLLQADGFFIRGLDNP